MISETTTAAVKQLGGAWLLPGGIVLCQLRESAEFGLAASVGIVLYVPQALDGLAEGDWVLCQPKQAVGLTLFAYRVPMTKLAEICQPPAGQ